MNIEEAKELLSYHSCSNDDINNKKWEIGFLGSLRPFTGKLYEENFHEVMQCLRVLFDELNKEVIDKRLIADIFGIIHTTQNWALHKNGMLQRNNLLTREEILTLEHLVYLISQALMYSIEGCAEEAFNQYKWYCDGDRSFLED